MINPYKTHRQQFNSLHFFVSFTASFVDDLHTQIIRTQHKANLICADAKQFAPHIAYTDGHDNNVRPSAFTLLPHTKTIYTYTIFTASKRNMIQFQTHTK